MDRAMIRHSKYDKLSDDLYMLGYNVILRFNVSLSKQLKDGKRYSYHHEYEYSTSKFIDQDKLITIRRNFDYHLSIENIREDGKGNKEFIMIGLQNILIVRKQFEMAVDWFIKKNLFAVNNDNKLVMLGKVEPIQIFGLPMSKYLILEPIIINYENNMQQSGVRIFLSSDSNFVDMNLDKFMGLVYLLNSINMYESACLLINYLQRPEFGTNLYNFNSRPNLDEIIDENAGFTVAKNIGRKVKMSKSVFDKIEEL